MSHGDFIWTDLSAYDPDVAKPFYTGVMGWNWSGEDQGYYTAFNASEPVATLYQMPQKFLDIGMPSFWMSYIAVDDAAAVAAQIKEFGGKVELGPEEAKDGSCFALIRDPLGAGFTIVEGLAGNRPSKMPGARAGHGLFVSEIAAIKHFYETPFGWRFGDTDGSGVCSVSHNGAHLFYCHEIPDQAIRGKEQYWSVFFQQARPLTEITGQGGTIDAEFELPDGPAVLVRDPHGAAFILLKSSSANQVGQLKNALMGWVGLGLMVFSIFSQQFWPWAIFMGIWMVQGLRQRETWLLTQVRRDREPLLYWLSLTFFAFIAAYSAVFPFGAAR